MSIDSSRWESSIYNDKPTTTLKFLPVCNFCGSVIRDEVREENGIIYPRKCPVCGKYFEFVEMPLCLPFDTSELRFESEINLVRVVKTLTEEMDDI